MKATVVALIAAVVLTPVVVDYMDGPDADEQPAPTMRSIQVPKTETLENAQIANRVLEIVRQANEDERAALERNQALVVRAAGDTLVMKAFDYTTQRWYMYTVNTKNQYAIVDLDRQNGCGKQLCLEEALKPPVPLSALPK